MQIITPSGVVVDGDATLDCLKVSQRWAEAGGYYHYSGRSGALTTVAAGGHLFGFRNGYAGQAPNLMAVVDLFRVRAVMTTPFTTAQEWGIEAIRTYSFTVFYNTGFQNPIYLTQASLKDVFRKRTSYPASGGMNIGIAATGALSGQTFVNAGDIFEDDMAWELAAGATVPRSRIVFEKDYTTGTDCPMMFMPNEGFAVRNIILMGAAGVMRLSVEVAWHEVDPDNL